MPLAAVLTSPERILDLDNEQHRISGWNAIEELLHDQLGGDTPDDDPAGTFAALREQAGDDGPPPFVLANLIVDHAREPGVGSARSGVTGSVSAALEQLVENAYPPSTQPAARGLLDRCPQLAASPQQSRRPRGGGDIIKQPPRPIRSA